MTTTSFCRKISVSDRIAFDKYARRLEADEMIIHENGSISLYCADGCICENYRPSAKELYK